jgi:hypothetical protein
MLGTENNEYYTTSDWNDQTFRLGRASLHTTVALEETNSGVLGHFKVNWNVILMTQFSERIAMEKSIA